MRVTKRGGRVVDLNPDKIASHLTRIAELEPRLEHVDVSKIADKVVGGAVDLMHTRDLGILAVETAAGFAAVHPDNDRLAARLVVSDLHGRTPVSFVHAVETLYENRQPGASDDWHMWVRSAHHVPLVTEELVNCAYAFRDLIDAETDHSRDYRAYSYLGIRTLLSGYLLGVLGEAVERPSHMLWRVSFGIHGMDWDRALATYRAMSRGDFTHATPTLFNACTPRGNLSSCFISEVFDDSIEGIYDTIRDCAVISKSGGGLGIAVSRVRARGAIVRSSGLRANGIMPALRVMNETARHVTQGGKRRGSIAVYMEPHHADIFSLLDIRKNHGVETDRARDLFPAVWASDLFMERVGSDADWTLMSPDTACGLESVHGDAYRSLYESLELRGLGTRVVRARDLWNAIMTSQIETGTPYLLYKDTVNRANAQANAGPVRCSNLCAEICLHTSPRETAVCNLASISLPRFVASGSFDFARLADTVALLVRNLDAVIDRSNYPTEEARRSNEMHRPIGIGVQGLADAFIALRLPFDSQQATGLNVDIFECIYISALRASSALAREKGRYPSYPGSPASNGTLQPDMFLDGSYGTAADREGLRARLRSPKWGELRAVIAKHGLRNSVVTALMPTAASAQILGNVEAFEPLGSNMYVRRTLSGEFTVVNASLVHDLQASGRWTEDVRMRIMRDEGSVQGLDIPDTTKTLYRTVWEIPQKSICRMAADRAPFVDQSQSLNVHMASPTHQKLSSLHFHNWRAGLKTSSYYLRTCAASSAIKFTVPPSLSPRHPPDSGEQPCTACSS